MIPTLLLGWRWKGLRWKPTGWRSPWPLARCRQWDRRWRSSLARCTWKLLVTATSLLTLMSNQCVPIGRGCLETVASAAGIVNLTRRYADDTKGSQLKVLIDNNSKRSFWPGKKAYSLLWSSTGNFSRCRLLLLTSVQPWTHLRWSIGEVGFPLLETSSWMVCARSLERNSPTSAWILSGGTATLAPVSSVLHPYYNKDEESGVLGYCTHSCDIIVKLDSREYLASRYNF